MEDYLNLEIPVFKPHYRKWKRYGYEVAKEKANTREVLLEAGRGYCMYCYTRIVIDGRFQGHLEHAIEKNNSKRLTECIPNIGVACSQCNISFKKCGEKKRKLEAKKIIQFHNRVKCTEHNRKQCTVPCAALRKLQKEYCENADAHFILQPMGVKGAQSNEPLMIQYDVLMAEFQPANNTHTYSVDEVKFIKDHIKRFRLNDPQFRTKQLQDFVKNVVDNYGNIPQYEFNNLIVELFAEKLKEKTACEAYKICSKIYLASYLMA